MIGILIFDIILSIYQHPDYFHSFKNLNNGNKKENVFSQMFKKIYSNFKQKNQKDHLNVQFNKINENFSKLKNEEVDI